LSTAAKFGIVQPNEALSERLLRAARELPAEELAGFIGQLETAKATAWARLTAPAPSSAHDELLDVATAAARLGVSQDYLYRHAEEYSFTRRQGRKLLFSALGIEKHIRQRT
jgi:hypothetical protein